ncbi:MAG: type II toxin-antitoxin system HicA family toxin, partial [Acidobacteriota bacterium]|nr:type II toxin-antitoxin system HicA family toxin [Acidobacteriota bacterium]
CKRNDFIRRLRRLGFEGTYSGAKHQFMVFGNNRLTIPSNSEYSVPQLRMMLREVEEIIERQITIEEWNELA